jgi:hypothetical protein
MNRRPPGWQRKRPWSSKDGAPDDSVAQLTQLKSLLDSGALTQEEFDAKKQKIIGA